MVGKVMVGLTVIIITYLCLVCVTSRKATQGRIVKITDLSSSILSPHTKEVIEINNTVRNQQSEMYKKNLLRLMVNLRPSLQLTRV